MSFESSLSAADQTLDRARLVTIAAAIICISVAGIGLSLTAPLISLLLSAQGVSATAIGAQTAFASLAGLLTSPFVPRLARSFGLRNFLLATLALAAFTMSLFPLLPTFFAWCVLRFLFACSINALFVLSEYWINAAAPNARRGFIMGIYATSLSLGFAAGPALLVLNDGASLSLFPVGGCFFAVAAVPIFFAGRDAPPLEGRAGLSIWRFILIAPVATMAAFIYGAVEQGSFAFMALYGEALQLGQENGAWLLTLFGLGNVVSQIPLGLLSDRTNRPLLLLSCALISAVGALAMPLCSGSLPLLLVLVFVTGGMAGGLYTIGLAHLGSRFSGTALATANATFIMLYALGMMISTPVLGVVIDAVRPHGFAFGLAALFGLYALLVACRLGERAN
ncbi:MFS transporter [Labrys miyagiensis]|uniref:MFS transporter n=1 Tax=Labrys miyagiensis TaxID=346912 RepID=A0ABQ6CFI7_9HYPH|nr:MFS transporter [Labrys miyagiensis]GLS18984.1 MFS transporter [Labrys miyagiensis]